MNNYEKIKAMSIDEMAEFFDDPEFVYEIIARKEIIKQWLESESE